LAQAKNKPEPGKNRWSTAPGPDSSLTGWAGGSRRILAIVFTDVVGSTAMASQLTDRPRFSKEAQAMKQPRFVCPARDFVARAALGVAVVITAVLLSMSSAKAADLDGQYPIRYDEIMKLVAPGTPAKCSPVGTGGPMIIAGNQASWQSAHGEATGTINSTGHVIVKNTWGQIYEGNFTVNGGSIAITNPGDRCSGYNRAVIFGARIAP
jgi:hypothetical protein